MKLRKLILSGFKSFADKTEFDFDDGISCVVGPNGCGKSNVVDAVKWVLGEQSAKSLRGSEMMDVIFNGSSARKPSGMSSVTLVFDNDMGMLKPVINGVEQQVEEVSITRRLYRSGQSEYLINNNTARLKDIREMFLDTGLGGSAYSIIEQGKVSAFLQAGRDERRAFFDEAAGISRYKARKKEASRKLDRVEQNMLRLTDILAEVEKRLRSIKMQAGKARNYQTYAERLSELKALFFLSRFHTMRGQRTSRADLLEQGNESLATIEEQIAAFEAAQNSVEVEAKQLQEVASEVQARISNINAQITTLHERAEMQKQRLEECRQRLETNEQKTSVLRERIDESKSDIELREVELEQAHQQAAELQEEAAAIIEAVSAAEMQCNELRNQVEDERSGINELARQIGRLQNDSHAAGLKIENLSGEKQRHHERLEELSGQHETLSQSKQEFVDRLAQARMDIDSSQSKLDELQNQTSELVQAEQDLGKELAESREERSRLQGRMHTLEEMQKRMVGVGEATRKVLEQKNEGDEKFAAIRGMLGDFIETDVENAPIVEAALGGADQRLVATSFAEVQQISGQIEELFDEGGSVEIICTDLAAKAVMDDAAVTSPLAVGRVLDLVRFDSSLEPVMWNMLGQTYLVRSLGDAATAAENSPAGYRFVTMAGEVLEADGRVRIGSASHSAGMIARKSELQEIQACLSEIDGKIESLDQRCSDTKSQRQELEAQLQEVRSQLYQANFEKSESEKQLETLAGQLERLENEKPILEEKLQAAIEQMAQAQQRKDEAQQKIEELTAARAEREGQIEAIEEQLAASHDRQQELAERRTEIKVTVAEFEQKKLSLTESLESIKRQVTQMSDELESAQSGLELDQERMAEAQEEINSANEQGQELLEQLKTLQEEYADGEESRRSLSERLNEIRQQLTAKRSEAHEASQQVGNLRVKLTELDTHIEDLIERAAEEMEMNIRELYNQYEHDDERDWEEVEAEINDLRGKISRLGNVNLDAITEQEELEKREEFLRGQLDDINESRRQLEALIERLNVESRQRFVDTFNLVRDNFQVLFRKLFGGGKADIMLSDEQDVLESGIDIVARPPGKEPRSISLLSGGEQTMSALALMFSFFQARPSPFCLLDEVDAALDEANNERYNAIVQEFAEQSQFIMITHSKRTMAIAKVMYGVTMQELGVSKRVSVKFEEADTLDQQLEPVAS